MKENKDLYITSGKDIVKIIDIGSTQNIKRKEAIEMYCKVIPVASEHQKEEYQWILGCLVQGCLEINIKDYYEERYYLLKNE